MDLSNIVNNGGRGRAASIVLHRPVESASDCGCKIRFVMQLDSGLPQADGGEWLWGGGGAIDTFRCAPCRTGAHLRQCTQRAPLRPFYLRPRVRSLECVRNPPPSTRHAHPKSSSPELLFCLTGRTPASLFPEPPSCRQADGARRSHTRARLNTTSMR
ncbi:hypothetical protein GD429_09565 [Burkholderia sp. BE17]|nr:hypothetical protein [Burkholderia sp. BE17]